MRKRSYYLVNGITMYRLVAAPVLLLFIYFGQLQYFKWLLAVSFFTDAIDGFLARRYKVNSSFGARLDSMADDFTIFVALVGIYVFKPEVLKDHWIVVILLLILLVTQNILSLIRYKKLSSFHTYSAKLAAVIQGVFILLIFFMPAVPETFFYLAAVITAIDLLEEIILVFILKEWKTDVKGIYWVLHKNSGTISR